MVKVKTLLVKYGSNAGQTPVTYRAGLPARGRERSNVTAKHWSNAGQMPVKYWSNTGRDCARRAAEGRDAEDGHGQIHRSDEYWSNATGQILVKHWFYTGAMLVKY